MSFNACHEWEINLSMADREDILANFQVNEENSLGNDKANLISIRWFPWNFFNRQQQITAIEDIEVAICHLESTGWNLEVRKGDIGRDIWW